MAKKNMSHSMEGKGRFRTDSGSVDGRSTMRQKLSVKYATNRKLDIIDQAFRVQEDTGDDFPQTREKVARKHV